MNKDDNRSLFVQLSAALQEQLQSLTEEREAAIEKMQALGARTDDEALQTLISYLTQDENTLLRPLAASRIGEIGNRSEEHTSELQSRI